MAQIDLFNGKNMDGWHARGGGSEHAWSAIGGVALNPDDNKLLAATLAKAFFTTVPQDEQRISTQNMNTVTVNCTWNLWCRKGRTQVFM